MSCGVGHRYGSDLVLLWLWHRSAAAAPISPLAWELPCAAGAALKKKKNLFSELLVTKNHYLLQNNYLKIQLPFF